jgi:peptidyl-prolyl cis-trans isomerase B (cyclophilin B)
MKIPTKEIKIPKVVVYFVLFLIISGIITAVVMSHSDSNSKTPQLDLTGYELVQLEEPKDGQDIAVIETSAGTMKAMLFSEECPNTAALFKQAVADGAYKNLPVTQIEKGVLFICKTNNEQAKTIPNEYHKNLWPFRGAICTISDDKGYGSEDIFFVNTAEFTDDMKQSLSNSGELQPISDAFLQRGGIPNFSIQYTVFAQVYDGLDVIDKITASAYDEDTGKPLDEIVVKDITISVYKK